MALLRIADIPGTLAQDSRGNPTVEVDLWTEKGEGQSRWSCESNALMVCCPQVSSVPLSPGRQWLGL